MAYWESGSPYPVEGPVRHFWLLAVMIHELAHTFEAFLLWFYMDSDKSFETPVPEGFKKLGMKKAEIGFWMEVQLLGGTLSNGDDQTKREKFLRVKQIRLLNWPCR
jgi:hypothetical protein